MKKPESWVQVTPKGLYVEPGDFYVDPVRPVPRALVTHGHADHARPGNDSVLATPETLAIMRARYGERAGAVLEAIPYGETRRIGDVAVTYFPAGHVLGSAQILMEHKGCRIVASGDYKRRFDPTCATFQPIPCDVFITEATFGLPVFVHPPAEDEIGKLLASLSTFPERAHLVGAYSLGKAQRVMKLLRLAGWERTIYLHGAMVSLVQLYESLGVALGPWARVSEVKDKKSLQGEVVMCPPSALDDRWSRRLPEPVTCMASGWMRIRQRARQRGAELPLVISDHADWPELMATIDDVGAPEIWITHGREEALMHAAVQKGYRARALALIGFDEEGMETALEDEAA
jgi:putative mRNA 3-end processing factor